MSRKRTLQHPQAPTVAAAPGWRFRWEWAALGVVIAVGIGAAVYFNTRSPIAAPARPTPEEEPDLDPEPQPGPAPEGMVWIPGGTFWMGDDDSPDRDAPVHRAAVNGFWMDRTEVTNAQFAEFVKATGYVTVAERTPTREQYPDAPPERLVPGSAVFHPRAVANPHRSGPVWWEYVPGANWRHPEGPNSSIVGRENHPVVQIAWEDAMAYAKWANKRLPTEAEWEFAARGGLDRQPFCWGAVPQGTDGKFQANTWQGVFPRQNSGADGYVTSSPVASFPPNGYGLHDMSGNAWEWCADWYRRDYYLGAPKRNPQGPAGGELDDFGQSQRVRRGGSFLCADEYCKRYLPGTRDKNPVDSSANHTGFRCVRSAK